MTPEEQKAADEAKKADEAKAAEEAKKAADEASKLTEEQKIAKAREEAKKEADLIWQKKFDTKNTELQKKIAEAETLRKEKMTDDEKRKYELDEKERVLKEQQEALTKQQVENAKLLKMNEKSIPIEFKDRIIGQTAEEIEKDIDIFNSMFQSAVTKAVEARLKESGATPGGSGGSSSTTGIDQLRKQFDEAKKSGNQMLASQIYSQIEEHYKKK